MNNEAFNSDKQHDDIVAVQVELTRATVAIGPCQIGFRNPILPETSAVTIEHVERSNPTAPLVRGACLPSVLTSPSRFNT